MFPLIPNIEIYRNFIILSDTDDPFTQDGVLGLDRASGLFSCTMNDTRIVLNGAAKDDLTTFEILEIQEDGVKRLGGLRNAQH